MDSLFKINGLMFWNEHEVKTRDMIRDYFDREMRVIITRINPAVDIRMVETPTIMPRELLNPNYTDQDIWALAKEEVEFAPSPNFTMRAETTPGSYVYARHLLDTQTIKPPFCIFQSGKSYRREDEHPTKYMRLREFYQMEWQWIYTEDTANDYHAAILDPARSMIQDMIGLSTRIVASDRLPSYSQVTMDIEANVGDRWMEIASISRRIDFPGTAIFTGKKGAVEKNLLNVEVAIGLDRCVYAFNQRTGRE